MQTQLEICVNLDFISISVFEGLVEDSREVERMLSSLIDKVQGSGG